VAAYNAGPEAVEKYGDVPRMPRRRTTYKTSSARSTATAHSPKRIVLAAALRRSRACSRPRTGDRCRAADTTILAMYARATNGLDVKTIETSGSISGEGLSGAFHTWRDGDRERDDESLGRASRRRCTSASACGCADSNGDVQGNGLLLRRALTATSWIRARS